MQHTNNILKELTPKKTNRPGTIVGRTDGDKLVVQTASGQKKIITNSTGRFLGIGAAVTVSKMGGDQTVIGSDGIRDEIETIHIRGC